MLTNTEITAAALLAVLGAVAVPPLVKPWMDRRRAAAVKGRHAQDRSSHPAGRNRQPPGAAGKGER